VTPPVGFEPPPPPAEPLTAGAPLPDLAVVLEE
jgi:hypothetical protein